MQQSTYSKTGEKKTSSISLSSSIYMQQSISIYIYIVLKLNALKATL